MQNTKKIKFNIYIVIVCLIFIVGCSKPVVKPTTMQEPLVESVQEPSQELLHSPAQTPVPPTTSSSITITPIITSMGHSITAGKLSLKINGSGFDSGAIAQIYNSSGKPIASGILSGKDANEKMVAMPIKGIGPGKYTVKVKNPDGQFSNEAAFTISKPIKPEPPKHVTKQTVKQAQCDSKFSKEPKVIYLGGGDAVKLFERYLAENSGIRTDNGNFDIKIKFYEKGKEATDISLQTVCFDDSNLRDYLKKQFFESWEDFITKIKERLKGRMAELSPTIADDAAKEDADYFQCP